MLEYFRKIESSGEELIVTDRDRPVLRIVPIEKKILPSEMFANLQGNVVYHGDILEPTLGEWGDLA